MKSENRTETILVVEDSATTRLILKQGLNNSGYQVVLAENGYQALLAFQQHSIDLILMDVNMPVMDGFECCEALRKSSDGQHIPIILLTGRDDHESINHAFEIGASDFITKPINLRLLVQRVRYGLRDAIREKELLRSQACQQELIKKLTQAQAQLVQSEKLASIGILAAGIAHEINNPLATLKANMYDLQRFITQLMDFCQSDSIVQNLSEHDRIECNEINEEIADLNKDTSDSFYRIQNIIDALMTLAHEKKEEVDVADIKETLQESIKYCLKTYNFSGSVTTHFDGLEGEVNLKKSDLMQVFISIIHNAIESVGMNGTLHLAAHHHNNDFHIEICDNGAGISNDHIDRIFDPFFTTKPPNQGTGLGLSIAYQIISNAGGQIKAVNQPDGGACIMIKLPVAQAK